MKFIPSRDLRIRPGEVWEKLRQEGALIVTSHGKPVALMVPVGEDDFQDVVDGLRRTRVDALLGSAPAAADDHADQPSGDTEDDTP